MGSKSNNKMYIATVIFLIVLIIALSIIYKLGQEDDNFGVTYPVLKDMELDETHKITLQNPIENKDKYILKYEFVDIITGEKFFETNWLEGGKYYEYTLDNITSKTHCIAHIYAKDKDTLESVNSVNVEFRIKVK